MKLENNFVDLSPPTHPVLTLWAAGLPGSSSYRLCGDSDVDIVIATMVSAGITYLRKN